MFYSQIASFRQPHSVTSRRDQFSISDLTAAIEYRSAAGRKVCTIAQQVTQVTNSPSGRLCDNAHRRPGFRSNRGNGFTVKNAAGRFRGVYPYSDAPRIDLYILEIPERRKVDEYTPQARRPPTRSRGRPAAEENSAFRADLGGPRTRIRTDSQRPRLLRRPST